MEAEAAVRGWIDEDAKSLFESAITQSFVFLKVQNDQGETDPVTVAQNYIENTFFANWEQWQEDVGSSMDDMVQLIAIQKYIANCGIDPFESWCDERRLQMLETIDNLGINQGAPYISLNPSRVSNSIPVRLLYPQSEYTTNSANVSAQGTLDPFNSKIFWIP